MDKDFWILGNPQGVTVPQLELNVDLNSLINVSIYRYILFIFFLLSCFMYILYLTLFPFEMQVVDRATIMSVGLQTRKSILSYFSYLMISTLNPFFFVSEVPLQETKPLLIPQILVSRNPQTRSTQKDLSYLCIMYIAPLTFFILSRFLECGCGAPFWFHSPFPLTRSPEFSPSIMANSFFQPTKLTLFILILFQ